MLTAREIRVLATHTNAELICALVKGQADTGRLQNIKVGNPLLLVSRKAATVDQIFRATLDPKPLRPSLGGWRQLVPADATTFGIQQALVKEKPDVAEALLQAHPTWTALSFVAGLDRVAACRLVAETRDPRWYIDPQKPDAGKRRQEQWGLGRAGEKNVANILVGGDEHPPGQRVSQARLLLKAWTGKTTTPPPESALTPNHFLWRLVLDRPKSESGVQAMLRASRVFLQFVHAVWLDNLTPARRFKTSAEGSTEMTEYQPQLFVPSYFFETAAIEAAFLRHVQMLDMRTL